MKNKLLGTPDKLADRKTYQNASNKVLTSHLRMGNLDSSRKALGELLKRKEHKK